MTKTNDIKLKTEQCFCKSYCDDDGIIQDCTCGKCELNDVKLENNCPSCGSNEHSYCGKPAKMWTPVNMNLPKEELIKQAYAKGHKDGREEERNKVKKIVDDVKDNLFKIMKVGIINFKGEKLEVITRYQAVNAINLSGLPYTSRSPNQTTKE